jgi:hypothetical protein
MAEWFAHCRTLEEARLEYRRLCFEHHPDRGGSTEQMQRINEAYERCRRELLMPHLSRTRPRSTWQKPPRARPADVAPERSTPRVEPEPRPAHSRPYIERRWRETPWQTLPNGSRQRALWGHTIVLLQHPSPRFEGAWFVLFDNTFSPYFYMTIDEAERAAFDLLYEQVKYREL